MKQVLRSSVCIAALLGAFSGGSAFAQSAAASGQEPAGSQAAQPPVNGSGNGAPDTLAPAPAPDSANGVTQTTPSATVAPPATAAIPGDIVVTAQRRSESVQKASLSIAALSSEALRSQGVVDSQSLNNVVPGLKIAYTGAQVQVFIRGVGDPATNPYTQASVSLNVDGVYVARSSAFGPLFFDTARVEVLRGPQGTLYGRNSTGGAINVISNAPTFDKLGGYASLEAGNYNLVRGQAVINAPLSDTLAIRFAAQATHRDGYLTDGANDDKSFAGRLRVLWKPTSTLSISLHGDLANIDGQGFQRVFRPTLFNDPWTGPNDPRITVAAFPNLKLRYPSDNSIRSRSISGELNWDLGGVTLTVLPAYRYNLTNYFAGTDYLFTDFDRSRQKSLEARLSGTSGPLKWVVGGFLFKENLFINILTDQRFVATRSGLYQLQQFPTFDTGAKAVFGEGTLSLTDRLRVIGGIRYTDENRNRTGSITSYNYVNNVAPAPTIMTFNQKFSENAVTWRGGAEFDVAPASMLFATVSRGFKSGGFDATDADIYNPEYVTAYTLGLKNRFFNNKLTLNLEGFYWKYSDQQVSFLGFDAAGVTSFVTRNAGQSTLYGLSVDSTLRITPVDTLSFSGEYNHTNYNSFVYATLGSSPVGTTLADGCVSNGPNTAQPGTFFENCSGNPLQRAPKWSGNIRYSHQFDLSNGGNITLGGAAKGQTKYYLQVNYLDPYAAQTSYGLLDADLTYYAPGGRWSLQAYMQNITNKAVFTQSSNATSILPTSGVLRSQSAAIGQPRTFGARLRYNF